MKKLILYLEDDANMRSHTASFLEEDGYKVEMFQRIDQVKEYFAEHHKEINCIVTDLNMSDEWLDEYQGESDGCILSGWVWLQHYVYNIMPNIPTIIYSGYIPYLEDYLRKNHKMNLYTRENLYFVDKGGEENESFEGLKKALENIFK